MGAGILPLASYKGKLYFLFSRESKNIKYKDSGLWSDFGGGADKGEGFFETAVREGWEESMGIMGTKENIKNILNNYTVETIEINGYKTYIIMMEYSKEIVNLFDKQYKKALKADRDKIGKNGLYEKDKIRWIELNDLTKNIKIFRPFYKKIIYELIKIFN
tara:strand:+ start:1038 stop:1520 length:483 start_codon:yes stop_codon:yes gene_type:complete